MEKLRFESGNGAAIEISDSYLEILREGYIERWSMKGDGDKRIQKSAITGIEASSGGWTKPGHILIQEMGHDANSGTALSAPHDENSVTFHDESERKEAKEAIEEWLENKPDKSSSEEKSPKETVKQQFAKGEITEDEYRKRISILEDT